MYIHCQFSELFPPFVLYFRSFLFPSMTGFEKLYYVNSYTGGVCVKECPSISDFTGNASQVSDVRTLVTYGGLHQVEGAQVDPSYIDIANYEWVTNNRKTDSKNETNNHSQLIILIIHSTHQHHPSIHPFIHHFFPSFLQQHIRCHLLQRFRQSQRRMLPRSIRSHYQLGIRRHCPILWHGLLCRWYLRNSLSLLLYRRSRKRNSRPSRRRRQWRINPRRRCPPTHE